MKSCTACDVEVKSAGFTVILRHNPALMTQSLVIGFGAIPRALTTLGRRFRTKLKRDRASAGWISR